MKFNEHSFIDNMALHYEEHTLPDLTRNMSLEELRSVVWDEICWFWNWNESVSLYKGTLYAILDGNIHLARVINSYSSVISTLDNINDQVNEICKTIPCVDSEKLRSYILGQAPIYLSAAERWRKYLIFCMNK